MSYYKYQRRGEKRETCKDVMVYEENDEMIFAGVADGAGCKKYGREGGMIALKSVCDYLKSQNIDTYLETYFDQRQYEIISMIRRALSDENRYGNEISEYASTLCVYCCDKRSGNFIIINLGDGCIAGESRDHKICMLKVGEQRFAGNYTFLTTTEGALSHIQMAKGKGEDFSSIWLMTDGFYRMFRKQEKKKPIENLVVQRHFDRLDDMLENEKFTDDALLLVVYSDKTPVGK